MDGKGDRFFCKLRTQGSAGAEYRRVVAALESLKLARQTLDALVGAPPPPPSLAPALVRWVRARVPALGVPPLGPARDSRTDQVRLMAERDLAEAAEEYAAARYLYLVAERAREARAEEEEERVAARVAEEAQAVRDLNRSVMEAHFPTDPDAVGYGPG
jgi:hypothetical protein